MKIKHTLYEKFYHPIMMLCIRLFHYLPVKKNKIVFNNDLGLGYGCNLKYVCDEILRQQLPYELVWIVKNYSYQMPAGVRKSLISRIKSVYDLSTAKIVINNIKGYMNVWKKESQYFIYIPHGQTGAKKGEKEMNNLTSAYLNATLWHSSQMDLFVTCSTAQSKDMVENFWCTCEILQCGFPRNDIFFKPQEKRIIQIKRELNIPLDKKCLLYAPTFRDNGDDTAYALDMERLQSTLSKKYQNDWVILVRLHPNFFWYKEPHFEYSDTILNVTTYDDIQELFLISDILITDYSSTMFDFNNTHRPIFLFATDVDEYRKMRGLKDFYFTVPFPLCRNNDELMNAIEKHNEQDYKKKLEAFNIIYGDVDDGHASERVVERLKEVINGN